MLSQQPIYLDYNATTPCDPDVVAGMLPYFAELYANPGNGFHMAGRQAHRAIEESREKIAALINAHQAEIIFTASATESNNLAILGLARASADSGRRRIVTTAVEHKAVLAPCHELQQEGYEVAVLPVEPDGLVSLAAAEEAINDQTLLVSVQAANNELGTLQPVSRIADLAHEQGALVHCDAAQAVGKVPVDVRALNVDILSMSAHKFYGPKGIGALFIRRGWDIPALKPLLFGGGQERGLRPGTPNVPAVVGFGIAADLAQKLLLEETSRIELMRDNLESFLERHIPNLVINGRYAPRLSNTSSLVFPGLEADTLLLNMPELMLGTGSACTSGAIEPSHVLQAIGLDRIAASATVRLSLGRFTRVTDAEWAGEHIWRTWQDLQARIGGHNHVPG
jgi:cysteine desulfurase